MKLEMRSEKLEITIRNKLSRSFLSFISYFSLPPSHFRRGFTLVEVIIVMAIALMLMTISTMNLSNVQRETNLSATVDAFLADMKEQQIKAMVGDTEGSGNAAAYGIRFETTGYTLFRGSYGTANFTVDLPDTIQVSTTLSGSDLIFERGSGNVSGFAGSHTITFTNTLDSSQQVITINRYGVVTGVN